MLKILKCESQTNKANAPSFYLFKTSPLALCREPLFEPLLGSGFEIKRSSGLENYNLLLAIS